MKNGFGYCFCSLRLDREKGESSEEEILNAIGNDFNAFKSQVSLAALSYKEQVNRELFCEWVKESFF